jgi:hypothetical protein
VVVQVVLPVEVREVREGVEVLRVAPELLHLSEREARAVRQVII